jgi:hypothetical protein
MNIIVDHLLPEAWPVALSDRCQHTRGTSPRTVAASVRMSSNSLHGGVPRARIRTMPDPTPLREAAAIDRLADDMKNERVYVLCPNRFWSSVVTGVEGGTFYLPTPLGLVFVEPTDSEGMWAVIDSLPRVLEAGDSVFTWPRTNECRDALVDAGITTTPDPEDAGELPLLLFGEDGGRERMPKLLTDALSVYRPISAARIRARARHT